MRVHRKAFDLARRLEAHVVVAMGNLRVAARIDDVELRGDLIEGPEPGLADEGDRRIAVIGAEDGRVGETQLLQRVPDAVIRARLGEMIAAIGVAPVLLLDHRPKARVRCLDRRKIGESAADHDDAGPIAHRLDPFGHHLLAGLCRGSGSPHRLAVVDQDVRDDIAGEGIVRKGDRSLDERPEGVEVAAVLGQEDAVGSELFQVVVLHGRPPASLVGDTIQ